MNGIFKYSTHFKDKFQTPLSLGEGSTPLFEMPALAKEYGIEHLYIKDETTNPSGSFKDRAIAYQLSYWTSHKIKNFVISSSGNAAISAALYASTFDLTLDIFISSNTPEYKLKRLEENANGKNIIIHFSKDAKREAIIFGRNTNAINLLGSKDDNALEGYMTLGLELEHELEDKSINGIFICISSGTGLLGMSKALPTKYPLYGVQTTRVHALVDTFDNDFIETSTSLANAITAHFIPRKNAVLETIKKTGGSGFVISDNELIATLEKVKLLEHKTISYDSALSLAGLNKALTKDFIIKNALCILTGI